MTRCWGMLVLRIAATVSAVWLTAADPLWAGPRLDYRGMVLSRRQAEGALGEALGAPTDSAALSEGLGRMVASLQDLGYLDARAHGTWINEARGSGDYARVLRVEVAEGQRYAVRSVILQAPGPGDSTRLAEALHLPPGRWASPGQLGEEVEEALRRVVDQGYPYAQLGVSAFDWDAAGARVRLSGVLGPAVTVSEVRIRGLGVTRPAVATRAMGRLVGEPYSRAAAEAARDRLVQLGLFRHASFEGLEGEGDWGRGKLLYRVEEPHYNRFEGVVGVQGDRERVGLLRLELDNLAGTGRSTALRWDARGHGVESFAARYAEPFVLGAPLRAEIGVEQYLEDTLYTRTRWGARLRYILSGQERMEGGYEQERVVQPQGEVEEADLQTSLFALERDARDDRLSPRRGSRGRVVGSQTFKREHLRPTGERSANANAFEGTLEWHRPLGGARARSGVVLELSAAGRFSSQRVLPLYERYAVGGAASLRGHDEQSYRVDRYGLSRLEWRWFLGQGRQRLALFWDHAWMGTRLALPAGGYQLHTTRADGVGFGLRIEAAGGLVGLDYGLDPGRSPSEGKLHLQLVSSF